MGSTGWGKTLAALLSRSGSDVCVLTRTASEAEALRDEVGDYRSTHQPAEALEGTRFVFWAVPSQTMRSNVDSLRGAMPSGLCHVSVSQGA